MNILLLGSGGRESALAWKIKQSDLTDSLFIAPGNGGTGAYGTNVALSPLDFEAVDRFVADNGIDMIVVGNEDPLVAGIALKAARTSLSISCRNTASPPPPTAHSQPIR